MDSYPADDAVLWHHLSNWNGSRRWFPLPQQIASTNKYRLSGTDGMYQFKLREQ
jgi:hypothetical protein